VGRWGSFGRLFNTRTKNKQATINTPSPLPNRSLYVPGDGFLKRLAKEAVSSLLLALMLFQLAYPWGVGVSRFRDNRHNASDVRALGLGGGLGLP
jgi:hypothetical protein